MGRCLTSSYMRAMYSPMSPRLIMMTLPIPSVTRITVVKPSTANPLIFIHKVWTPSNKLIRKVANPSHVTNLNGMTEKDINEFLANSKRRFIVHRDFFFSPKRSDGE